jgi:type I restriction enzyme M protein
MADERSRPPINRQMSQASPIPAAYAWPALRALAGDALFHHYRHTLEALGRQPGTPALIGATLSRALGRRSAVRGLSWR